jgi:GNAT superfamily N-acetyltransferase
MRFLLDTNILIPLEDSQIPLRESLATFVRLANENGHQLVYHPASEDDIRRDGNVERRRQTLERLKQYGQLERIECPWNDGDTSPNDTADNEILYALDCDAAHALVTEDRGIHESARVRGLSSRVYTIQTAEDWLTRLHSTVRVELPNIEDVALYTLTQQHLESDFFDSLREGYPGFNAWFRAKAREDRHAWVTWEQPDALGAICIYTVQTDERVTEEGLILSGEGLKLSTFKVGPSVRGRKIGELFLKAAFRHATANELENIFIHGDLDQHHFLFELMEDFGFEQVGTHPGSDGRDVVYVKKHPTRPPEEDVEPFEYLCRYFPHYRSDTAIGKYIVPIQPQYHSILFPDYTPTGIRQLSLFDPPQENTAGNAIKLAYLCHARIKRIKPGDLVLFYRSEDERAVTSLGVVEEYQSLTDAAAIARLVSRRTVYSMKDIEILAIDETRVMLFRLIHHFDNPVSHAWLKSNQVVKGNIQSIRAIDHGAFERVIEYAAS